MDEIIDRVYIKNPDIVYRCVAGQAILVPIAASSDEMGAIFTLNETAARIWELIDGTRTVRDIAGAIAEEFAVDGRQAAADTCACVDDLHKINAIKKL